MTISIPDRVKLLSDGELEKRYAKLMGVIERIVADVNGFVPHDLAEAREHFEAEIGHRSMSAGAR